MNTKEHKGRNGKDTEEQPAPASRPRGGRPSKEAAARLERQILETASDLFAAQGFAATSMEQVASRCNAGKDTIYRRYPSKAALFNTLVTGLQAEVLADLDAALGQDGTALDRLRQYARAMLAANMRPQLVALNRVVLSEPAALGDRKPETGDPIMQRLTGLVEAAQNQGALGPGDAEFLANQLLYATSIRPLMAKLLGESDFDGTATQDDYFYRAWDLFLKGAAARCRDAT
ncbi:TetR/AcrR family transcriptional regulator [Martelella mangrovi]|uniref:AcrR family transcriptional regulator n=1 Tax=Martelella mangrovi TaxID=1397477 RepID=A0ABV2IB49_9HYPH